MESEERVRDPRAVQYGELPEVTRALRAMGSSRRSSGAFQTQFFLPLLEARKRAAESRSALSCLRAFDAGELGRSLETVVERIVTQWPDGRAPARRALRAELLARVSTYVESLDRLSERAASVMTANDEPSKLAAWRDWTAQLVATFEAADRSWMDLRSVIDSLPARAISREEKER